MGEEDFHRRSSRSEAQPDDVSSSPQEDRSVPAGEVGEGEGSAEKGCIMATQVSLAAPGWRYP
jgi:hypothetical protein